MTLQYEESLSWQRPTIVAASILVPAALQFGICPHCPPDPTLLRVLSVFWDAEAKVPLCLCTPPSVSMCSKLPRSPLPQPW